MEEVKMISQGLFKIEQEILEKVLKEKGIEHAKKLLWEMLNWGGRTSCHEYDYWMEWLKKRIKEN